MTSKAVGQVSNLLRSEAKWMAGWKHAPQAISLGGMEHPGTRSEGGVHKTVQTNAVATSIDVKSETTMRTAMSILGQQLAPGTCSVANRDIGLAC